MIWMGKKIRWIVHTKYDEQGMEVHEAMPEQIITYVNPLERVSYEAYKSDTRESWYVIYHVWDKRGRSEARSYTITYIPRSGHKRRTYR